MIPIGILRHGSHMRHKLRLAAKRRAPRRVKLGDFISPWLPRDVKRPQLAGFDDGWRS